ncbi:MAG: c-type cytochrome [Acidobacteria bacterium]|nr:c-type cytochrome [Acidobacteriota bacterium]
MTRLLILFGVCLLALNCSNADSLGDEPPVEIAVSGSPTYLNGVGELLKVKCGYCHAHPLTDLSPDNIVNNLDLNSYETRLDGDLVVRGADAIGRWIEEGILEHDVAIFVDSVDPRKMPLDYGTPLTQREIASLHQWSDLGSPKGDEPPPLAGNADHGESLYDLNCGYCHGDDGEGVPADNGYYYGPQIRRSAVTAAKVKSMWLHRSLQGSPLSDSDAADIVAHVVGLSDLAD